MEYKEALREWGAQKLENYSRDSVSRSTVKIDMDFNAGYACCGGRDPDCYCSFAESPSANVVITGETVNGRPILVEIDHYNFNFVQILGEIVEVGKGTISN